MDKIQLLPDTVANLIAAGEVVQRPASVIKELVENAVDAGATQIDVLVIDAGRTSIQVVDNGSGMSVTDARLAFERHATSKIRKADDLFSLNTMGFRGEALPSIASVAQVTLKTRQENDALGVALRIDGGRFVSQEPVACSQGCHFMVENIFYNVPVRRRFLKSNTTELNNIVTAFQRIALVYPKIGFTLRSNSQILFDLRAATLHQRITDVFGKKINQHLLPLDVETTLGKIEGFVGKPESARKKGAQQYFFVNGRYMRHPYFQKAVMEAYDRLVPHGEQVPFFLYFTVNPKDIDVNIHPTKTEIKFQDEQALWQILAAAVRESVGRFSNIPSIDFDTEGRPEIPVFDDMESIDIPTISVNPSYNPFSEKSSHGGSGAKDYRPAVPSDWSSLYEITGSGQSVVETEIRSSIFDDNLFGETADEMHPSSGTGNDVEISPCFQYKGSYILTPVSQGLMLIDQERAHERILFERYETSLASGKHTSQPLLFPEKIQFSVAEMVILPTIIPQLENLGFDFSDLGGGTYAINAVPGELNSINAAKVVSQTVEAAGDTGISDRKLYSSLAATMARNSAVPHGQVLSEEEMRNIVRDLFRCSNSNYAPSGKKIHVTLRHDSLLQMLG
ncbi:MAG: DNA mismatch repair endonuclease MutL [Clostridium sp.]|nr:DNA mismatch repair endonuclease MutL [Clostridium sp.]